MKPSSFKRACLKALGVASVAAFALSPIAEARPGGGGGHMGGGGGHMGGGGGHMGGGPRPGGGGGPRPQINNVNRDARVNNVRNTSVNNVNVNRNVVVAPGGYRGGWDNDYHPVATAAAVTATVAVTSAVVGSMVRAVPAGCVPVNYGGLIYQQCGSTWYQPQGGGYVVINPPY